MIVVSHLTIIISPDWFYHQDFCRKIFYVDVLDITLCFKMSHGYTAYHKITYQSLSTCHVIDDQHI